MNQTAWMIERSINGVPHWWMREDGQFGEWDSPDRWTTDPNKGRKYDSKAAAEYVIGGDMVGCVATEHVWAADCFDEPSAASAGYGADDLEEKDLAALREVFPARKEFTISAAQMHMRWGFNRTFRVCLYAVEKGKATTDDGQHRFTLK